MSHKLSITFFFFFLFCSENTKNVLIAASFIHLKHREHAKFTSELTTVNPRILLSGPAGVWILYLTYLFWRLYWLAFKMLNGNNLLH